MSAGLEVPPPEVLRDIAAKQDRRAREIRERRANERNKQLVNTSGVQRTDEKKTQENAAQLIQRNYRGYRKRRELHGYALSPSARWSDAVREAHYRTSTQPRSKEQRNNEHILGSSPENEKSPGGAKATWKRAGIVVRRAGHDEPGDSDEEEVEGLTPEQIDERKQRKNNEEKTARMMGLEYFLEMVDTKHRYGSSLRRYHKVWQESGSDDNFFYWLDYGDGLKVDLEERPRKRLDEEQIRYLSKEERQMYQVELDDEGRLIWAKNGQRITTSPDFKDSIDGIVPAHSKTPTWREVQTGQAPDKKEQDTASSSSSSSDNDSDSISGLSAGSDVDDTKYVNQELHDAKGVAKIKHLSTGTLMNNLLRKTTKKNTWIFVADTSYRLYIGIKQSGAFQHSSFLHGGRVSSAGLIRIKRGQLRRLDPLSGHYAPPAKNFRNFVHSLEDAGADMSRVSISRSYAILVGLESYLGAKKRVRKSEQKVRDLINPEEKRKREEKSMDHTKSAQREREVLEEQRRRQEEVRREKSVHHRLLRKLHLEDRGESKGVSGDGEKGKGEDGAKTDGSTAAPKSDV